MTVSDSLLPKHHTFLTLEVSQYRASGSTFSSSELVADSRPAALVIDSETPYVDACPSDPSAQTVSECGPKSSAIDLQPKLSTVLK